MAHLNGTEYREEQFIYTSGWSAVIAAAGGVALLPILIAADCNFLLYYITITARQGAAGAEVLFYSAGDVSISWAQTGKSISNAALPIDVLGGNGRDPYILPQPRLLPANTTATIACTNNLGPAATVQFNVCLHGSKLYVA